MDPTKDRIGDLGKQALRSLVSRLPEKGILKPTEVRDAITRGRASVRVAPSVSSNEILQFALRDGLLKQAKLEFPSRKETRYFATEPHPYELALSVGRNCYLTHQTALYLHGLVRKEPSVIYVNSEQGAKATWDAELTQEAIDQAFQRPPRITNNLTRYGRKTICLLSGKFTGRLGVTQLRLDGGNPVQVTDLERTLVDIAVRPHYSGGVFGVLKAYRKAGKKASISRIVDLLAKLSFVYPYHQAIGFYLEKSGRFAQNELNLLRKIPMESDFYLAHQMKEVAYSQEWRVYYPKSKR